MAKWTPAQINSVLAKFTPPKPLKPPQNPAPRYGVTVGMEQTSYGKK